MQLVIVPILVNGSVVMFVAFARRSTYTIVALIPATGIVAVEHNSNLESLCTVVVVFSVLFNAVKSVKLVPSFGRPTNVVLLAERQLCELT